MRTFLSVAVLAVVVTLAAAGNLYPRCGGNIMEATLSAGTEKTLRTVAKEHSRLEVTCVAVEVERIDKSSDECAARENKNDNADFRLYLLAKWLQDGDEKSMTWDLSDTIGGSVQRLRYSLSHKAQFQLVAAHTGDRCAIRVRALFEYTLSSQTEEEKSQLLPVMTGMFPITAYADRRSTDSFFMFKILGGPGPNDHVTVIPGLFNCRDNGADGSPATLTTKMEYTRVSGRVVKNPELHSFWKYKFTSSGNFRICYKYRDLSPELVAIVTTFGGNPGYFTVADGAGAQGEIFLNVPTTVRFYGDELDTRPGGDQAKFVVDSASCQFGNPAGGVAVASDLGPGDTFGLGSTFADWHFVLKEGGVYRVCYKRKGHEWTEVVSIDDLPREARHSTPAPLPDDLPPPTHAVTHKECDMAPHRDNEPEGPTYLQLSISTPELSKTFRQDLAQTMCVPTEVVDIIATNHFGGSLVVTLDFVCHGVLINHPCSGRERKNMLLYRVNKLKDADIVKELKIFAIAELKVEGVMAISDDKYETQVEVRDSKRSPLATFMICVTVLAVCAAGVWGFKKYREGHPQFIQFGLDDDDDDANEVDDPATLPPLPTKGSGSAAVSIGAARHAAKVDNDGTELH